MEVRIYRSAAELDEVRGFWISAQQHPNSDLDHFLSVCRLFPGVIGPCVISVWHDDQCCYLLVGRVERSTFQPKIGYARFPRLSATIVNFIYAGCIGDLDETGAEKIVASLNALFRQGQADAAIFNLLSEENPLWLALKESSSPQLGTRHIRWSTHRVLSLKSEPGFLVRRMRSKHRSAVKRMEKKLNTAFPGRVCWSWHSDITNLADLCKKMESVAKTTYQRGLGAGFINNVETRERLALFLNKGQLRIFLLEINGVPKAFWLGEVYNNVFYSSATGYTPDMRDFQVGTLIFLRMVDKLILEDVSSLDFGRGDAHYKQRFSDHSWRESTVQLFAPNIKGRLLHAIMGICGNLDLVIRNLAERLGLVDRIKKLWRTHLADKAEIETRTPKS